MKNILAILSVVLLTLTYSYIKSKNNSTHSADVDNSSNPILKDLPNFEAVSLRSGIVFNRDKIKNLKPKMVIVHFWGTWCAPCEAEFPSFLDMAKKLENQKNIYFLFIAVKDLQKAVEKFIGKFPQFPKNVTILLNPNGEILQNFGTVKVPETYIFDAQLKTQLKLIGPQDWSDNLQQERILKLLK